MGRPGRHSSDYPRFAALDGSHPLRDAVPDGFVDYRARRRPGEVVYFNFTLAREMGLIPRGHPARMTAGLRRAILDTFCIVVINEYDEAHGLRVPRGELRPGRYMATRYLQLQHHDRTGRTSGDGRGLWNGTLTSRGVTWDVASCGTGVTRLCPATAATGRLFKTGSTATDYCCGTCSLEEALATTLMSETFHRNGIATERTLAVIATDDGFAIHVRAGRNLLRPSHFFGWLKQGDLARLRGVADLYVERQIANGDWPAIRGRRERYRRLAEEVARTFGRVAATFEREYIFCWLDWDGDNVLVDGGIIDYGSVRQFGLYHREYRFDDGPRWSTTIPEQRRKAREIVRCFAQIRDALVEGRRPPLRSLSRDPVLGLFDRAHAAERDRRLLHGVGLDPAAVAALLGDASGGAGETLSRFRRAHAWFERARSARGPIRVNDGITWNAIYSTRDLLRELPEIYRRTGERIDAGTFLEIAASTYATARDRRADGPRRRAAARFQRAYLELVELAARRTRRPVPELLGTVAARSATINRYDRITGDAVTWGARRLARHARRLGATVGEVIDRYVEGQRLEPGGARPRRPAAGDPDVRRILDALLQFTAEMRYGL